MTDRSAPWEISPFSSMMDAGSDTKTHIVSVSDVFREGGEWGRTKTRKKTRKNDKFPDLQIFTDTKTHIVSVSDRDVFRGAKGAGKIPEKVTHFQIFTDTKTQIVLVSNRYI